MKAYYFIVIRVLFLSVANLIHICHQNQLSVVVIALKFLFITVIWPVCVVGKGAANGTGGLGFDSQASQIRHSVANGSPLLRFFFRAVSPRR